MHFRRILASSTLSSIKGAWSFFLLIEKMWSVGVADERMLVVIGNDSIRCIPHATLWTSVEQLVQRRLRWFGHAARRPDGELIKDLLLPTHGLACSAGALEARWKRGQPRSRQAWGPSPDRGKRTGWKSLVSSHRAVEAEDLWCRCSIPGWMPPQVQVRKSAFELKPPWKLEQFASVKARSIAILQRATLDFVGFQKYHLKTH